MKKLSMKKDNRVFLEHILEAINNIENYVKNITSQEEFASNNIVRDAVLRNFQVIGEAANNLDEDFLKNSSEFFYTFLPYFSFESLMIFSLLSFFKAGRDKVVDGNGAEVIPSIDNFMTIS